jgi:hypothetical protein
MPHEVVTRERVDRRVIAQTLETMSIGQRERLAIDRHHGIELATVAFHHVSERRERELAARAVIVFDA